MILTIAFTQFVFVSLGILALNVLLQAGGYAENVAASFPALAVALGRHGLWVYCIPLAWVAFAVFCDRLAKGPWSDATAQISGVVVTGAIFVVYVYAAFLCF
ncbi:MAG: hypothetical protein ACOYNN_08245 [Terrimicrobiaceae bacterium]|jgi:hypothetical protein